MHTKLKSAIRHKKSCHHTQHETGREANPPQNSFPFALKHKIHKTRKACPRIARVTTRIAIRLIAALCYHIKSHVGSRISIQHLQKLAKVIYLHRHKDVAHEVVPMHRNECKKIQNHYPVALPCHSDHFIEISPRLRCRFLRTLHFLLSRIKQRVSVPIRHPNNRNIPKQENYNETDSDP